MRCVLSSGDWWCATEVNSGIVCDGVVAQRSLLLLRLGREIGECAQTHHGKYMKTRTFSKHTACQNDNDNIILHIAFTCQLFSTHNPWAYPWACPWAYPSAYCQGSWIQLDIICCWICQHVKEGTYLCEFSNVEDVELCSNNMPKTTQVLSLGCGPKLWELIIQICWQKHSRSVTRISTRFNSYYYGIIFALQHYCHA